VQARQLGAARKMHDVDVELDMALIEQAEEALEPLQSQIRGASESEMHEAQYSNHGLRRQSGKCQIRIQRLSQARRVRERCRRSPAKQRDHGSSPLPS
jgi:hypothetical protein